MANLLPTVDDAAVLVSSTHSSLLLKKIGSTAALRPSRWTKFGRSRSRGLPLLVLITH